MVFYWRGKLYVNENKTEGLLQRFYLTASDSLRAHALDYVGRSLSNTKDAVEIEILKRLKSLWLTRLESARSAEDSSRHLEELAAFGAWFLSGKFDDSWAIAQLIETLSLVQKAEPEDAVIERLATLSQEMPAETVRCLSLMIEGAAERWKIDIWEKEIRIIVSTAMNQSNVDARDTAKNLVNRLGSKGFFGFHDLLNSQ